MPAIIMYVPLLKLIFSRDRYLSCNPYAGVLLFGFRIRDSLKLVSPPGQKFASDQMQLTVL
jgi:hypothetical protein